MSHTISNLEHHHFKYPQFRRPGDLHVHFFGTATLSFADGVKSSGRGRIRNRRTGVWPAAAQFVALCSGGRSRRCCIALNRASRIEPVADALLSQRTRSRAERKVGFRTAILQLVLGALFLTVTCIGVIGYFSSARTLDDVREKNAALVSLAMSQEVGRLLGTADKILPELRTLSLRGSIDLHDLSKLGVTLAELLRREEDLSWLSYSDARSGRFIGARRRDDGSVVINQSDPQV